MDDLGLLRYCSQLGRSIGHYALCGAGTGAVGALLEGREESHKAVLRMNRERGALMELYPDQWVAVGRNGVIAVAGSLEDVFARVESVGLRDSEFEVEFLDTDSEE